MNLLDREYLKGARDVRKAKNEKLSYVEYLLPIAPWRLIISVKSTALT